jgi:putative serine protease PepD
LGGVTEQKGWLDRIDTRVVALVAVLLGALVGGSFVFATVHSGPSPTPTSPPPSPLSSVDVAALAKALQERVVAVVEQVGPSVVEIEGGAGTGSGVVYDSGGDIVTNAHVAGTSTSFTVTLANGDSYPATLVGSYVPDDIAVIRVKAAVLAPARFGDSSKLHVGDFVLAIGNPLGLRSSVSEGIVSALGRQRSEPSGYALPDVIQTSADINPGNSGGALVDLDGKVVGIPTLGAAPPTGGSNVPGIGFAISSNRARTIADQLIATGRVTDSGRADAGLTLQTSETHGAQVIGVDAGGPGEKAGIVAGDTVTAVDKADVPDYPTYTELIAAHHPGDAVTFAIVHQDGATATVKVILGTFVG